MSPFFSPFSSPDPTKRRKEQTNEQRSSSVTPAKLAKVCSSKDEKAAAAAMMMEEDKEDDERFEDASSADKATPLSAITDAFEDLASLLSSARSRSGGGGGGEGGGEGGDEEERMLRLGTFCNACSLVSILFGCLGLAFKFAELEYDAKVRDLVQASKTFDTLQDILNLDVENDTVKRPGSHTRNLRRVRQGLDLIRALFENFLSSDGYSLKEAASTAYSQTCAPYHTWAVRTAVYAGMYTLPTRDQLLIRLNETDQTAQKNMRRYIEASRPVIEYIDKLYTSRNITLDW